VVSLSRSNSVKPSDNTYTCIRQCGWADGFPAPAWMASPRKMTQHPSGTRNTKQSSSVAARVVSFSTTRADVISLVFRVELHALPFLFLLPLHFPPSSPDSPHPPPPRTHGRSQLHPRPRTKLSVLLNGQGTPKDPGSSSADKRHRRRVRVRKLLRRTGLRKRRNRGVGKVGDRKEVRDH